MSVLRAQKSDVGKDRYRAMIEALAEGVLLVSRKHRIVLANRSAEEMLSWAAPLEGKDISAIFESASFSEALDSVFKEKRRRKLKLTSYHGFTGDEAIIHGKGREKHYKTCITSLDDKYAVITITDVTRIERLAIVRQDFVSNVSHELKTPLTAISGFSETLLDDGLSRDEIKGFARIIQKNSAHMQRIISDLLLLTSLDRSEIAPSMAVTTDTRILSEVRSYTQYKAETKDIEVVYESQGKNVLCNESLIVQAIINLVVNAISYSPEKGLWRCFGACKVGGDVVALHQKNYRLRSRREAEESLYKILGLRRAGFSRQVEKGVADECVVAFKSAYAKATMVARTVDDWDELDYIMSQHPPEVDKLEAFYNCRRV